MIDRKLPPANLIKRKLRGSRESNVNELAKNPFLRAQRAHPPREPDKTKIAWLVRVKRKCACQESLFATVGSPPIHKPDELNIMWLVRVKCNHTCQ